METNQKEKSLDDPILKQIHRVLVPGDIITIKFKASKFSYLDLVVREIPNVMDSSIEISNG